MFKMKYVVNCSDFDCSAMKCYATELQGLMFLMLKFYTVEEY